MAGQIPHDIFFDIFSRLPVEPLLQLKSVCKSWPAMIDDPCLATMHLTRAAKSPGAVLLIDQPTKKKRPDSTRKPDSTLFRLLKEEDGENYKMSTSLVAEVVMNTCSGKSVLRSSCNGLLCFSAKSRVDRGGDVVFLCNPLRQEAVMLPRGTATATSSRLPSYGLGFDSTTNTYKIVHIFFKDRVGDHAFGEGSVEVHTLGTNSWRKVSEKLPCPVSRRPVFAYGALHWTTCPCFTDQRDVIISFDMANEVFYSTLRPDFNVYHLVELGGLLAIVDLSSNMRVEIWFLKDKNRDGAKEWVKEYMINMKAPNGRDNNQQVEVVGMLENGEILLRSTGGFFSYNPNTDRLRCIYIPGTTYDTEIIGFRGSLLSPSRLMNIQL